MPSLREAYSNHRHSARQRGIAFLLSYEQWLGIWQQSGHLPERGCHKGQYVMARCGDSGAYEVGNVQVVMHEQNIRETDPATRARAMWASAEYRAKQLQAQRRIWASPDTRARLSEIMKVRWATEPYRTKVLAARKAQVGGAHV
jgi:hypothetical protein